MPNSKNSIFRKYYVRKNLKWFIIIKHTDKKMYVYRVFIIIINIYSTRKNNKSYEYNNTGFWSNSFILWIVNNLFYLKER